MAQLRREDWIRAAIDKLASEGVDRVRVEPLAKTLGVSKGSFYWHFEDRRALLDAVLEAWEEDATSAIIREMEALGGKAEDRLWALAKRTFGTPVEHDRHEAALRAWASNDEAAQIVTQRVDKRRITYVKELLEGADIPTKQARLRAQLLYRTLVGEFVMRSSGDRALGPSALRELHTLLLTK